MAAGRSTWFVAALLILTPGGRPVAAAPALGDLSGPWHLFVDDYVVAERTGVTRVYHPFAKSPANPVMVADRPWESTNVYLYGTVLPKEEGGGYRMWYHSYDFGDGEYRILYATSADGLRWDKPNLRLVEYRGSLENNILFRRTREDHSPQVIHTPWETDPQRRYKLINYDYGRTPPDHVISGYWGAWSADGIHWTDAPVNPVLVDPGDVGNFVWDPHTQRYIGYPKKFADVRGYRRRCAGFSATTVFEAWPAARLILVPDEYDDRWVAGGAQRTEFYGLSGFAYESMYLGFLWVFRITDGDNDGPIFVELVSSHDGIHWVRQEPPRDPILPLGADGSWDDGMVFTPNHPLVEAGVIKLFYGGWDITHGAGTGRAAIGLATLRKDGFASLEAGPEGGTVTTKPLRGASGTLRVNYSATAGGSLRVEVTDGRGRVVPGYGRANCTPLTGDHIDAPVRWGDRTELPSGFETIALRFVLHNASLYSFSAGEGVTVAEERGLLCTAEGEGGEPLRDRLPADGEQTVCLRGGVTVDSERIHAAFGGGSLAFDDGTTAGVIELADTWDLGRHFTLSAMVNDHADRHARLFSTYSGQGPADPADLIFDFDPSGSQVPGLRCLVNGTWVISAPRTFADSTYHHLAMTYDDGQVRLYLDGADVGGGSVPAGWVRLRDDLRFGGDAGSGGGRLTQDFDAEPVGSSAGWEGFRRWFSGPGGHLAVTDTDACSWPNCLRWSGDGGSCQLVRPWGFASDGSSDLTVTMDIRIVARAGFLGITPFVYRSEWGGSFNGPYGWPAMLAVSPGYDGTLGLGFSYYEDGTGWINFLVIPAAQLIGNWFRIGCTLHPVSQTVDVTVTQLEGPGAGTAGSLTGRRFQYGAVTEPGWYTPALDDLRGSQIYAWDFLPDESVLIDNFSVRISGPPPIAPLRGYADDVLVLRRSLSAEEIRRLSRAGAARFLRLTPGADIDSDMDVDVSDFAMFQACFNGSGNPPSPACPGEADLDEDGDVDLNDFAVFQTCFNGAGRLPACEW